MAVSFRPVRHDRVRSEGEHDHEQVRWNRATLYSTAAAAAAYIGRCIADTRVGVCALQINQPAVSDVSVSIVPYSRA